MVCNEMTEDEEFLGDVPITRSEEKRRNDLFSLCPSVELTLRKKIIFFPDCMSQINLLNVPLSITLRASNQPELSKKLKELAYRHVNEERPIILCFKTTWPRKNINGYSEKIQFSHGYINIGMTNRQINNNSPKNSRSYMYLNVIPNDSKEGLSCRWTERIFHFGMCLHQDKCSHKFYTQGHCSVLDNSISENAEVEIVVEISSVAPIIIE